MTYVDNRHYQAPGAKQKGATVAELCSDLRSVMDEIARLNDKAAELKQAIIEEWASATRASSLSTLSTLTVASLRSRPVRTSAVLWTPSRRAICPRTCRRRSLMMFLVTSPACAALDTARLQTQIPDLRKLIDTAITSRPLPPRCTVEVINDEDTEVTP